MHHHRHDHEGEGKRLLFTVVLNVVITLAEFIGGFISGSLALLSDALHNLTDVTAMVISYFAHGRSEKEPNIKKTFGYKRAGVVAAYFNTTVLLILAAVIIKEAIERFNSPNLIQTHIMIAVAAVGFLGNLFSIFLLHGGVKKNINIRAAFLHLLSDTLSSAIVIIGGIMIRATGIYIIDHILSLIIGIYILYSAIKVLLEAMHILMEGTPEGLELNKIKAELEKIRHVENIHHLHIWSLSEEQIMLECHVDLDEDLKISETEKIKKEIEILLSKDFAISHTNLQFEFGSCTNRDILNC